MATFIYSSLIVPELGLTIDTCTCVYTHTHTHTLMRAVLTISLLLSQALMFRVKGSGSKFIHHSCPSLYFSFRKANAGSYFKRTNKCRDMFVLLKCNCCLESLEVTQLLEYNSF